MRIRTSLMATAVLVGLGLTGQAAAQQTIGDGNGGDDILANISVPIDASNSSTGDNRDNDGAAAADNGAAAANNGGTATSTFSSTSSTIVAQTVLEGAVYDVQTYGIGNVANNTGNANGGAGGRGGDGYGGDGYGGRG